MSSEFELEHTKRRLERQIKRSHSLAARCMAQVADADLPDVDRESAAKRARLSIVTAYELEHSLERVEEALSA